MLRLRVTLSLTLTFIGLLLSNLALFALDFKPPAQRIVSLAPSMTEVLFAIGAGDRVVGVTIFDDYPEEVKDIPKVGDLSNPNIEKILELKPDLVLGISNLHERLLRRLESLGIHCYSLKLYESLDELYSCIESLGKLTGKVAEAKDLIEKLKKGFAALSEKGKSLRRHPKVFIVIWDSPLATVSQRSYINELIEMAGGKNVVSDSKVYFPVYNVEYLIKSPPDIVVVVGGKGGMGISKERFLRSLEERGIMLLDKESVYEIDGDLLFRLSPRVIEGANRLYEVFKRWAEKS